MKLIIDIDEDVKGIIDRKGTNEIVVETIWKAVKNGIPLPKGHGRLVDADTLYREIETEGWFDSDDEYYGGGLEDIVLNAPTIIEADKGE